MALEQRARRHWVDDFAPLFNLFIVQVVPSDVLFMFLALSKSAFPHSVSFLVFVLVFLWGYGLCFKFADLDLHTVLEYHTCPKRNQKSGRLGLILLQNVGRQNASGYKTLLYPLNRYKSCRLGFQCAMCLIILQGNMFAFDSGIGGG